MLSFELAITSSSKVSTKVFSQCYCIRSTTFIKWRREEFPQLRKSKNLEPLVLKSVDLSFTRFALFASTRRLTFLRCTWADECWIAAQLHFPSCLSGDASFEWLLSSINYVASLWASYSRKAIWQICKVATDYSSRGFWPLSIWIELVLLYRADRCTPWSTEPLVFALPYFMHCRYPIRRWKKCK